MRKSIAIILDWVVFGVLFTIFYIVSLNIDGNDGDLWFNIFYQMLGAAVWTLFFFLIVYSYVIIGELRFIAWSDFRLRCLIKLEVFPDVEGTIQDRILNKIKEIYPIISTFPPGKGVLLDARATRLLADRWDFVVNLNSTATLDTSKLVLVRILGPEEVGEKELKAIGLAVLKLRILKPISEVEAVFIASPTGFSPKAVDMTMRGKVRGLPRLGTRLILVKERGFKLES